VINGTAAIKAALVSPLQPRRHGVGSLFVPVTASFRNVSSPTRLPWLNLFRSPPSESSPVPSSTRLTGAAMIGITYIGTSCKLIKEDYE
jgi:hypothetical protein